MSSLTIAQFLTFLSYLTQGVALTGRNTTGPPSFSAIMMSYAAYTSVTDDDRRQQTPATGSSLALLHYV